MFAYCRNNPVNRYDIRGYSDSKFEEKNDDEVETAPDPNDGGGGGGSGTSTVGTAPNGGSNGHKSSVPTYPKNPYDFKPKGLKILEAVKPGTKPNGGIIKWLCPKTNVAIFEWDEDYKNGPHYHAMMVEWNSQHLGNDHIKPGSAVEEPWRSEYF